MTPPKCEAYQASDQMVCPKCHLAWDKNDPDPPECLPARHAASPGGPVVERRQPDAKPVTPGEGRRAIERALRMLSNKTVDMTTANPMDHKPKPPTEEEKK